MTLQQNHPEGILKLLDISPAPESWFKDWAASQSCLPERIFFLQEGFIKENCRRLEMSTPLEEALLHALRLFKDKPDWRKVVWHQFQYVFAKDRLLTHTVEYWPIPNKPDRNTSLVMILIFLSAVPELFISHGRLGIKNAISVDTLSGLKLSMENFHQKHGYYGTYQTRWSRSLDLFKEKMITIGRLQYEKISFKRPLRAFRHHSSAEVVLLANPDTLFRGEGYYADAMSPKSEEESQYVWRSEWTEDSQSIRATRFLPIGRADRNSVFLKKSDWSEVLSQNDPVWDIHIPATGPMGFEDCGASLHRAVDLLPKYFPDYKAKAFACHSWFLDPQLEDHLDPNSNIIRFMREFYLHPVPGASDRGMMNRVFGDQVEDIHQVPQNTSLKRAVATHIKQSGVWRDGSFLMFSRDLDWGKQVYRDNNSFLEKP